MTTNTISTMKFLTTCLVFIFAMNFSNGQNYYGNWQYNTANSCTLYCPDGRRYDQGRELCECKSAVCSQVTCELGQMCVVRSMGIKWSITDVAKCVKDENYVPEPATTTPLPTVDPEQIIDRIFETPCQQRGVCDANTPCPDAYFCREDGRCCRPETTPKPRNPCLQKPDVGNCRAFGAQYCYDTESGRCRETLYAGCVRSLNSFSTAIRCNEACVNTCMQPRQDQPRCNSGIPRYYYNSDMRQCVLQDYAGCQQDNNLSKEDCEEHCPTLAQFKDQSTTPTTQNPPTSPTPMTLINGKIPAFQRETSLPSRNDIIDRMLNRMRDRRLYDRRLNVPETTGAPTNTDNLYPFVHVASGQTSGNNVRLPSYADSLNALRKAMNLGR